MYFKYNVLIGGIVAALSVVSAQVCRAADFGTRPPSTSSFRLLVYPYTLTPNASRGGIAPGLGVATSPEALSDFLGEAAVSMNFPYQSGDSTQLNDLLATFGFLGRMVGGFFLGAKLGIAVNISEGTIPTPYVAGNGRLLLWDRGFLDVSGGISATGKAVVQTGFGVIPF